MMTPTRLTSNQAAEYLGISRSLLYRLCADRQIGFERTSPGAPMRFLPIHLDAYLDRIAVRVEEVFAVASAPTPLPLPHRPFRLTAGLGILRPQGAPPPPRRGGGKKL